MSETTPLPQIPEGIISDELLEKISGGAGECTVQDYISALSQIKDTYDNLVDFTSYVIERVVGP